LTKEDGKDMLSEISSKLDILIRLSAISVVKGLKFKQQAEILSDSGFRPAQIAEMLGTNANNVRVTLFGIRKERAKTDTTEK
jgi:hypothetical protein